MVLLTNFVGDQLWLSERDFSLLISCRISDDSDLFQDLQASLIIGSTNLTADIELLATRYRTKKAFLDDFTVLHMVVTTLRCNQKCHYCHASAHGETSSGLDMTVETANNVAEMIMRSPALSIKVEFQGGEPSLNFPAIVSIVERVIELNQALQKNVSFVICTNLINLQDCVLDYLRLHDFAVSTSLDGPSGIHDKCRVDRGGNPTHSRVLAAIERVSQFVGREKIGALMTASRSSLGHFEEIVDEYVRLGLNSITFRSLNPYGRAITNSDDLDYSTEDFIESYKSGLAHIIKLNRAGIHISEGYTTLLLRRMLLPYTTGFVDLQSPAGAGISGVIYNYDGNIYACDEGRMLAAMGDDYFRLGSVHDSYTSIFLGQRIKHIVENSIIEAQPGCTDCVYRMWCGADPARHYDTQHDIIGHKALSEFCKKHMALFDFLAHLLNDSDPETVDILWSWVGGKCGSYSED